MHSFISSHSGLIFPLLGVIYLTALVLWPEKKPPLPLRVESKSVQRCAHIPPQSITVGDSHQVICADVVNDPEGAQRGQVRSLFAKITYLDCKGFPYLVVEKGLWKDGSCATWLGVGMSKQLILAIVDAQGRAFTIGHTTGPNPYTEHYEEAYFPFEAPLRPGKGIAEVRLTYSFEPDSGGGFVFASETQSFRFKFVIASPPRIT